MENNENQTNEQVNQAVEPVVQNEPTVAPVEPAAPVQATPVTPVQPEQPKKKGNKALLIILLIVILLAGAGCAYYFLIVKQQGNNTNTNTTTTTSATGDTTTTEATTTTAVKETALTGKINIVDYCNNKTDCDKEIGDVKIGDQTVKLSVNIKNVNTDNKTGKITLGSKSINFADIDSTWPIIDGFEVYDKYFIIYTSADRTDNDRDLIDCEIRSYKIYVYDDDLKLVRELSGYTMNNAYKDFKIENGILYLYEMDREAMRYEKIKFSDFVDENGPEAEIISNVSSC